MKMISSYRVVMTQTSSTLLLVGAAFMLRLWPLQGLGTHWPSLTFFPAVALAAMIGGLYAGVLATVLSIVVIYLWLSAGHPLLHYENEGLLLFVASCILLSIVSEAMIRARAHARAATLHVTDLLRVQECMMESERRSRALFEESPAGMAIVDSATGRIVRANRLAARMFGYSEEELAGKSVIELSHPDDRAETVRHNRKLAHKEIDRVFLEKRYRHRDGSYFWVQLSIANITRADGSVKYHIGSFIDLTDHKRNEQKIAEYVQQLEAMAEDSLVVVSSMVEHRDPYTAGHERRVGIIAADIARAMGWPEKKCHELMLIGLVHDIGKIGVPVEILSKPGRLTPLEFDLVKVHAEKGYEILRQARFHSDIAQVIRQHHERLDGSGYPQGLVGDQILPEARILAVSDVLESMASHRPYRPALGVEVALAELAAHAGTRYDAAVVETLLRMVREQGYTLPEQDAATRPGAAVRAA